MATRKICLLVLCGVPASGKSTLASILLEHFSSNMHSSSENLKSLESKTSLYQTVVISYDNLMSEEEERQIILSSSDAMEEQKGISGWKVQRNKIIKCVDLFISHAINKQEIPRNHSDGNMELWDRFLDCVSNKSHFDVTSDLPLVIIIDDNMYYSSMRYGYYQLARKYNTCFSQVYVKCDLDTALQRNKKRATRCVDEDVIESMVAKIEAPDAASNSWEEFSLIIEDISSFDIEKVTSLLQSSLEMPVQPITEEDTKMKDTSRKICSSNLVHQADQILRKLVGQKMADAKGKDLGTVGMKSLSERLRHERTNFLDSLRLGQILVTSEMEVMNSAKDENCSFYKFVKETFEQRLLDQGVT